MEAKKIMKRRFKGTVSSAKMNSTVIVSVDRTVMHKKYGKRYTQSKHYPTDSGAFELVEGDTVVIEECRPMSKTKRWRVVEKVS